MTGATDMPLRKCNRCGGMWMEDDQMQEETDRCPHCGAYAGPPSYEGIREEIDV